MSSVLLVILEREEARTQKLGKEKVNNNKRSFFGSVLHVIMLLFTCSWVSEVAFVQLAEWKDSGNQCLLQKTIIYLRKGKHLVSAAAARTVFAYFQSCRLWCIYGINYMGSAAGQATQVAQYFCLSVWYTLEANVAQQGSVSFYFKRLIIEFVVSHWGDEMKCQMWELCGLLFSCAWGRIILHLGFISNFTFYINFYHWLHSSTGLEWTEFQ